MPRKRDGDTYDHEPTDPEALTLGTVEELTASDDEIALQQFLGSLEGDAGVSVTVYRVRPNKPLAYLFKCGATDFSLDRLRDDHGGGDFRVRAYKGRNLIANKGITVEPPLPKAAPAVIAASGGESPLDLERILERQAMETRAMMLDLAKLMISQRGSSDPRKEFFETLTMVKQLLPPTAPREERDPMDVFMKGIAFARDVAEETGGGGEESGVAAIAKLADKYLPQILTVVQQPRAPAPNPHAAPGARPAMNPMLAMLHTELGRLVAAAKAGQPSDPFVDEILDRMPPMFLDQLVSHPDPVSELIKVRPDVADVRGWIAELIAKLKVALTEGDDEAQDPGGADPH